MMTRDAKIGLLVGLAFILIVGILLSEHITAATAPQRAQLAQAGDRVRRATGAPLAPTPAVADARIDADPQPKQAVVTREQLDSPVLPPTTRIELGSPQNGQIKVIRVDQPADPIASAQPAPMTTTPMLAATTVTPVPANDQLQQAALEQGMELVPAGRETPRGRPIANAAKVKEYVAQTGDSLGRMASRLLGANTPANRQLIISLNPSLAKDNNHVLVGAKYRIPADPWASALGVDNSEPAAKPANAAKPEKAVVSTVTYVVKAGDSLWKIADREIGGADALSKIKALNADVLGESEVVKVGMKLKLPTKK